MYKKALYRILPERKDVKGGGFHVTRRTFAANLLRNHAGIDDVMDALEHRDPTSVMKYLLLDDERSRKCALSSPGRYFRVNGSSGTSKKIAYDNRTTLSRTDGNIRSKLLPL